MHAPRGSRRYDQIPRGFENPARAQRPPEGDIELASRRPAPHQSSHDHTLAHPCIIPCLFCVIELGPLGVLALSPRQPPECASNGAQSSQDR